MYFYPWFYATGYYRFHRYKYGVFSTNKSLSTVRTICNTIYLAFKNNTKIETLEKKVMKNKNLKEVADYKYCFKQLKF